MGWHGDDGVPSSGKHSSAWSGVGQEQVKVSLKQKPSSSAHQICDPKGLKLFESILKYINVGDWRG